MRRTPIEWADWGCNPIRAIRESPVGGHVRFARHGHACVKVSPGCQRCYSENWNRRFGTGLPYTASALARVQFILDEAELHAMSHSRAIAGQRVFVCDMTDAFQPAVSPEQIDRVFFTLAQRPDVHWMLLAKRPERAALYLDGFARADRGAPIYELAEILCATPAALAKGWPLPNVWVGTSCEDQQRADERIPKLFACQAAVRFVSLEPLLGPIDVHFGDSLTHDEDSAVGWTPCDVGGRRHQHPLHERCWRGLDWVIVGGETGPGARPMHPAWVRRIRDDCQAAGVPFFFKSWGEWSPIGPADDSAPAPGV
ncbi:MAG TPA: DUF5131 family protein, partial [Phycisphaerae bacterium]|nr:DUF5131 family protein [Phycisphaerae bacterium]